MTKRQQLKTTLEQKITNLPKADAQRDCQPYIELTIWHSRWKEIWQLLPSEFRSVADDHMPLGLGKYEELSRQILQAWDRFPEVRDLICTMLGMPTVSEDTEQAQKWTRRISFAALAVSIVSVAIVFFKEVWNGDAGSFLAPCTAPG